MRTEAGLIMAGTLLGSGLLFLVQGPGEVLEWKELGALGGALGAAASMPLYRRWLAGPAPAGGTRERVPLFWQGVALLLLFAFWFPAALVANTARSAAPIERIDGLVIDKRVSRGRHSDSYLVQAATRAGRVETSLPKDVWEGVELGQRFDVLVCPGLLGYAYVVTSLDRGPVLDLPRLAGLRRDAPGLAC